MDHRSLYKSGLKNKNATNRNQQERNRKRTDNRHLLHTTNRQMSPIPITETTMTKTKKELHLEKYKRWQEEKAAAKKATSLSKPRPFCSTVPCGKFIDSMDSLSHIGNSTIASKHFNFKINGAVKTGSGVAHKSDGGPKISPRTTRSAKNKKLVSPQDFITRRRKIPKSDDCKVEIKKIGVAAESKNIKKAKHIVAKDKFAAIPKIANAKPMDFLKPPPAIIGNQILFTMDGSKITSTNKKTPKPTPIQVYPVEKPIERSVEDLFSPILTSPVMQTPRTTVPNSIAVPEVGNNLMGTESVPTKIVCTQSTDVKIPEVQKSDNITPETPKSARIQRDVVGRVTCEKVRVTEPIVTGNPESINYVSPFVSTSRGKGSARKELLNRESLLPPGLNDSTDEEREKYRCREAAKYYRKQLDYETTRLLVIINEWIEYKRDNELSIPTEYIDQIDVAIGQTQLLTSNKFQQYRKLIEQCHQCLDVQRVYPEDLEGFWSMVYIQVENCECRFERLSELRKNNWIDQTIIKRKIPTVQSGAIPKHTPSVNPFTSQATKHLRELMKMGRGQRKKVLGDKKGNEPACDIQIAASLPRKSPKNNLLAAVLTKEATKRSSLVVMKVSRRSKSQERSIDEGKSKYQSPKPKNSILKTPGTKGRAKSVLFISPDKRRSMTKENTFREKLDDKCEKSEAEVIVRHYVHHPNTNGVRIPFRESPLQAFDQNNIDYRSSSYASPTTPKSKKPRKSIANTPQSAIDLTTPLRRSSRNIKL